MGSRSMRRAWHSASTRDCVESQVRVLGWVMARSALPYRVTLSRDACPLPGVHELEHARPLDRVRNRARLRDGVGVRDTGSGLGVGVGLGIGLGT